MRTIRAAWVFPGTSPPIPDGRVSIDGGLIVRVGGDDPAFPVDLDLGDAAIVPGFVNAHTHLELGPIPWDAASGPENEVDWLRRVVDSRRDAPEGSGRKLAAKHVRSAIEAGTTALGDISTAGQSWDAVVGAPVWGTVFAEILGLSDFRSRQTFQAATDWLATRPKLEQTRPGLSPHAPYSTAGWLFGAASKFGSKTSLHLTTHLGEMPEERAFLQKKAGPLRDFVDGLGAWDPAWEPVGPSPIDYLDADPEYPFSDWIVAHGNIFEPDEFRRLTSTHDQPFAPRLAVAYCPRTHARFGHPPHPFRAMLLGGVCVCLGTDSLASSPSLSILDEVRFLHRHHPDVPPGLLLKIATLHGAWALRLDHKTGSLEPGKSADLAVLGLASGNKTPDPHSLWLDDEVSPLATMFRGQFVAGRWA